jgi:phage-related protein
VSLREINFSFDGKHCLRDFGCIYVAKKGRSVSPASSFRTFEIAGHSGTVTFGDDRTHELLRHAGTLYLLDTPPTLTAAQRIYRRVSAWLKARRRPLIWDYEPDKYLLCEVEAGVTFEDAGWIDGGLDITLQCQPFAYALQLDEARVALGSDGSASMAVPL